VPHVDLDASFAERATDLLLGALALPLCHFPLSLAELFAHHRLPQLYKRWLPGSPAPESLPMKWAFCWACTPHHQKSLTIVTNKLPVGDLFDGTSEVK
jgi:hypothetical protein